MADANRNQRNPRLTKAYLLSAPTGTYLASGTLGTLYRGKDGKDKLGPSWIGKVEDTREKRLAQWEEIKRYQANGRQVFVYRAEDSAGLPSNETIAATRVGLALEVGFGNT